MDRFISICAVIVFLGVTLFVIVAGIILPMQIATGNADNPVLSLINMAIGYFYLIYVLFTGSYAWDKIYPIKRYHRVPTRLLSRIQLTIVGILITAFILSMLSVWS